MGRGSKHKVVKCEIESCDDNAIIHPNGAKLCGKHKAADDNTRGRVSLKALGFKMDWKRAKKIDMRPVALAQLRACSSTLSVMKLLACRPRQQGHDYKVFGVIDDSRSISQTPYLLLDTVRFSSSKKCVPLTQMLIEYMGVKPPLLVVSITGADFNSTIDLKAKIKAIMDSAVTEMKNVWFITTGLGAGASAMVGRAVADFRKMMPGSNEGMMPVIGIIPWSDVPEDRRAKLGENIQIKNPDGSGDFITGHSVGHKSPRRVEYTAAGTPQWPDLDDCHTHYFFARDGSEDHKSQTRKQQILDDQRAANRLTKDLEDALKEEVKYMEHLRKWRRRYVNASTSHAAFEVVNTAPNKKTKSEIVLTSTIFPSSYALGVGFEKDFDRPSNPTKTIEWSANSASPTEKAKEFKVDWVEFDLRSVDGSTGKRATKPGKGGDDAIEEIVVVHMLASNVEPLPPAGTKLKLVLGGSGVHDENLGVKDQKAYRSGSITTGHQPTRKQSIGDHGRPSSMLSFASLMDADSAGMKAELDDVNEFDHFLEHTTKVGAVKLVISGSGECLEAAELAVRDIDALCPLVVFKGSGGFADVIALAWEILHSRDALSAQLQREHLDAMVRKVFDVMNQKEAASYLARIFNVCAVENKVLLFDVAGSNVDDLDKAMLDAIVNVARPDFEQINAIEAVVDAELHQDTWAGHEVWKTAKGKERKAEMVQNYELHLNALRFAMEVDRLDEMRNQLDAARKAYELMAKIFRDNAPAILDVPTIDEIDFDLEMAFFWWEEEAVQSKKRLILTFNEQVELALEWALDENKLGQVKLLKPMIEDFPMFLYGEKRCRPEEGYGTTLSELYEYEDQREIMQYLEPLLEFSKDEPTWNKIKKGGKAKGQEEPEKNAEKINNVRIRKVWSLVLQLLYDDDDKEAELDETSDGCSFGAADGKGCEKRWGPWKKADYTKGGKFTNGMVKSDFDEKDVLKDGWTLQSQADGELEKRPIDIHIDRTLRSVYELVLESSERDGGATADLLANQELMIWAVLFNRFELAEYFWQEGGCAIPNALLASRLLFGLSNKDELQQGSLADVTEKMNEMSAYFEQAAMGVLAVCYAENSDLAQDVLTTKLKTFDWMGYGVRGQKMKFMNSMELAFLADNMNFIAHPACQAVVDRQWRNGRDHSDKRSPDGKLLVNPGTKIWAWVPLVGGIELSWELFKNKMVSPAYKFKMDAIQYGCVLLLQSYCVLQNMKVEKPSDMVVEHVLAVWKLGLVFEEIRSMFDDGWGKVFFNRWWDDAWNKLDVTMYILFFITYGIRLTFARQDAGDPYRMNAINTSHGIGGKGMYGLICLIMYIRAFQYLSNDEGLGPKILVLGDLTTALMQYLVLLVLFIVAFGIFMEALANPSFSLDNNPNGGLGSQDWSITLHNVLYRPYFQMYGELMLEDISSETRCLGHTPFTGCSTGFEAIAIPVAIAIYMIATSLMIMNMLIADFTLTFERSLETASRTFKMNKFDLLQQYDSRPNLPVPLSLFWSLPIRFVGNVPVMWSIVRGCCCTVAKGAGLSSSPTADEVEKSTKVEDFQDRCCDTYLLDVRREKHEDVDSRVARIEAEVVDARNALQFFKGKWFTNFARRDLDAGEPKMETAAYPTYTVKSTLDALGQETACVLIPTAEVQQSEGRRNAIKEQVRKLAAVQGSVIIRGGKDGKWAPGALEGKRCSFYQEVARDAELVGFNPNDDECECREENCDVENPTCRYRRKGGTKGTGNPFGNPFTSADDAESDAQQRFDATTLGSFPDPKGENKMLLHIVTRWKRDHNGMTIDRGGRKLMEFVAFKREREDDMWSIPGIPRSQVRTPANSASAQVERIHFDSAVNQFAFTTKNFKASITETQKKFVQDQVDQLFYVPYTDDNRPNECGKQQKQENYPFNGKTIYEGFMDDERATASAWLTVQVVIHHDERGFLDAYDLSTSRATKVAYKAEEFGFDEARTEPPAEIAWLTLHRDLDLFGEEEDLLQHVANVHGAYW